MTPREFILKALEEDVGSGDYTSLACIPSNSEKKAVIKVKEHGIIAGVEEAIEIFKITDERISVDVYITDGQAVAPSDIVLSVSGNARSILKAERLALNVMQRMSGIATLTHKFVKAIAGYRAIILDTRKTTPNFRYFEKKAVRMGGGANHRFGLFDMLMIKDNHINYAGGIKQAIERANCFLKEHNLNLKIEIEAGNLQQVNEILNIGNIHRIMLDNFSLADIQQAVRLIDGRFETEVSGGVTLDNVRAIAATGVDYISVGALTHSYKSLDISLKAI